jgi:hypothetical protein
MITDIIFLTSVAINGISLVILFSLVVWNAGMSPIYIHDGEEEKVLKLSHLINLFETIFVISLFSTISIVALFHPVGLM